MTPTSDTRQDRFRKWFHIFDANGDGHIDLKDYVLTAERVAHFRGQDVNRELLVQGARARYAQIAQADGDGDGAVTEAEYLAATSVPPDANTGAAAHDAMARGGFASFDVDGDGVLSLSDFLLSHVAFGLNPKLQDVVERYRCWDLDGDGRITLDEFLPMYRKHQLTDELMPFFFCVG